MSDQDPPWPATTDVEATPRFGPEPRAPRGPAPRGVGSSSSGASAADLARVREQVTDLREELTSRLDEIEVGVRAAVDDRLTALGSSLRAELKHRIGSFSDGTSRALDSLTEEVRARVVGELGALVAALDADGDGLAGRLLAHQDAWERQAEVRVEANTRRVDEVISVLEQTSGALASVQQAVVGLNQQITAVSAHVAGSTAETSRLLAEQQATAAAVHQQLIDRFDRLAASADPDPLVARLEDELGMLRDELLLKQAALAGAVREALDAARADAAGGQAAARADLDARVAAIDAHLAQLTANGSPTEAVAELSARIDTHLAQLAANGSPAEAVAEISARIDAQGAALAAALREELDDLRDLASAPAALDERSTTALEAMQVRVDELTALPKLLAEQHRELAAALVEEFDSVRAAAAAPARLDDQDAAALAGLREPLEALGALQAQVEGLSGLPARLGEQQSVLVDALREELDDLRAVLSAPPDADVLEALGTLQGQVAALAGLPSRLGEQQSVLVAGLREELDDLRAVLSASAEPDARLVEGISAIHERLEGVAGLPVLVGEHQSALVAALREEFGAMRDRMSELQRNLDDGGGAVAAIREGLDAVRTATAEDLALRQAYDDELRSTLLSQQAGLAGAVRDALEAAAATEAAVHQEATLARQADTAALRVELEEVRATLVGAVDAALRTNIEAESETRLAEVTAMREDLMRSQLALSEAVRDALARAAEVDADTRAADAAQRFAEGDALRTEVTRLIASVQAGIDQRLTEVTEGGTEQVRADLAAWVARMSEVQAAVMRTELDAVLSSLEPRFDQIAQAASVESAVVAGLRGELKEMTDRAAASTVAALRDDVLELRMALNEIQSSGSAATDSLALLRTEGMMELRVRLAEDVEGNLERVAMATQDAIEAANARTADALRGELARFQRESDERRDNETSSLDQLVQSLRSEIESLRATLHASVAEANSGDAEAIAQLRNDLRVTIERTTEETVAALRSDVAGLRTSLGAVELVGAAAADGVAALRAEGGEALRGTLKSDLEALVAQLGLGLASTVELASGRSAEAVQEELLAFRRSIGEALQQETRTRESALQLVSDELQATIEGLDRKLTATLDVGARTEQERLDALRKEVELAVDELRTTLQEAVGDRGEASIAALRDELRASVQTLRGALADTMRGDTEAQQAQQRALRDELADALASVAELVVDTARSESQARAAAFDAAGQRIDQLARATAAVVGAQAELRNMLMQLWGQ